MPTRISEEQHQRFAELLEACLTKSGRKRMELARACHWDASLVTKILHRQARANLGVFTQFMAPFLVAYGGITQARQVLEMAELLGGELDDSDLRAVASAAERHRDLYQDQIYFRERADLFRQTISAALTRPDSAEKDLRPDSQPNTSVAATANNATGTLPPLQSTVGNAPTDDVIPSSTSDAEAPEERKQALDTALAHWQAVLRDVVAPSPGDELDPDEVIATVLEWESQLADPEIARSVWGWLGELGRFEKLQQKPRLAFVLGRCDKTASWNRLEWEWLDSLLVETARRHAGQTQISPRHLAGFVADLGQVAFEAIKHSDGKASSLGVNLNELRSALPIGQGANWDWLRHIAQVGPIRLDLQQDGVCQFVSREEAEFLAAHYLLQEATEADLQRLVQNSGRPFGVLRQLVRVLHFTGRDESVLAITEALLRISEVVPVRYLDAADLLAVCEARGSNSLAPLWAQVEEALGQAWAEIDAPEYQTAIARVMGEFQSQRFYAILRQTILHSPPWTPAWEAALRDLATLGGDGVLKTLQAVAESAPSHTEPKRQPLRAVLSVAHHLTSTDEAALLTALALRETGSGEQSQAVSALAEAGTIPALRALQHIARVAQHPKTGRYAETRLDLLYSPARAALAARDLDAAGPAGDPAVFHGLLQAAKSLLHNAMTIQPADNSAQPSKTLSRALARVWANQAIDESFRMEAALSLTSAQAWPAFAICVRTLPLVDDVDNKWAGLFEKLLVSLAPPTASPWPWQLLDKTSTPAQSALIIRCLGHAGGLALDERLEHLLTQPDETLASAAVGAMADSLGWAAVQRLEQVLESDQRPGVRLAAYEALAVIGSEQALPYLKEKLSSAEGQADACFQLARLHQPEAERLLAQTAQTAANARQLYSVYLSALAISGGAGAMRAIHDLLGPEPDELTLTRLREQFADDTTTRAKEVWRQWVTDASPVWRMTAAAVLARDKRQILIDQVVHLALDDPDQNVREFARQCLRWHAPMIASEIATKIILARLEHYALASPFIDAYALELLQKCLSGLAAGGQPLPREIVQRLLGLWRPLVSNVHPDDMRLKPLLAVFAFPELGEVSGDVAQLLEQAAEATVQRQALDTLLAMRAPGMFERVVRLARSSGWREIREYAGFCMAEMGDFRSLMDLPGDLKPILYRAAIRKDVRFQSAPFNRRTIILANGQAERL